MDRLRDDSDILIHPRKGRREKDLPGNGLLLVNPSEAQHAHRRWREQGGEARQLFNAELTVDASGRRFLAGPSIGAPMAVITLEKLIVLGAQDIVLFGWCGALSPAFRVGDILLPTSAISAEGTSPHYPHVLPIMPAMESTNRLSALLRQNNMVFKNGCVWSTDAVFRESRQTLCSLRDEHGVVAVDMEFSALCVVAAFRKVSFAAILIVSDELSEHQWRPGFTTPQFLNRKSAVLDLLLQSGDDGRT
jgi:uridine phosphorylase